MKNEDRIVELLAESLKKQDQHSELLTQHGQMLEKLVEGQLKLVEGQLNTNQKLEGLDTRLGALEHKFDKLFEILTKEIYERLEKLEKAVFKYDKSGVLDPWSVAHRLVTTDNLFS